jgi:putative salt-induced outer membrane protein YdiY
MAGVFIALLTGMSGWAEEEVLVEVTVLEIEGGAVLVGDIIQLERDTILLLTDYAGELTVDLSRVILLRSGNRFEVMDESGSSLEGLLEIRDGGAVWSLVEATSATLLGDEQIAQLTHSTLAPAPPELVQIEPAEPAPAPAAPKQVAARPEFPKWKVEGGLNLSGESGNSENFDLSLTGSVEVEREHDRFNLYGRYRYGEKRQRRSRDEVVLGLRYTNFVYEKFGFFVREELERDEFENINFRSTTAVGLTYRIRNTEDLRIEGRGGISFRFEDYIDDGSQEFPGLDMGLDINWKVTDWARFKGSYSYIPSVSNLEEFIFEQDSGFDVPLATSNLWKLRFGISSQYNNQPDPGRERLDFRYYARLIASWK